METYDELVRQFNKYGLDFRLLCNRVSEFMLVLCRSGITPAQASLEGYAFSLDLAQQNYELAAALNEAAARSAGIHSDQLREEMERSL